MLRNCKNKTLGFYSEKSLAKRASILVNFQRKSKRRAYKPKKLAKKLNYAIINALRDKENVVRLIREIPLEKNEKFYLKQKYFVTSRFRDCDCSSIISDLELFSGRLNANGNHLIIENKNIELKFGQAKKKQFQDLDGVANTVNKHHTLIMRFNVQTSESLNKEEEEFIRNFNKEKN